MQPPGAAFRSSTHTRLPLRTSNAAQTSELMPLPTMTTSKRSRGRILLVGDRGAGRTAEGQDGEASKARLGAPGAKIGAGEVEAIADLEQHAERHQESEGIHASLVVDQVLDGDEHDSERVADMVILLRAAARCGCRRLPRPRGGRVGAARWTCARAGRHGRLRWSG